MIQQGFAVPQRGSFMVYFGLPGDMLLQKLIFLVVGAKLVYSL